MATYTVTLVYIRPDTETLWPDVKYQDGVVNLLGNKLISQENSFSADNLTKTKVSIWNSKEDFLSALADDATFLTVINLRNTYMSLNNFTSTVTEEDGTVRVFNKSKKTFEVQE